ncbi:MAG: RnfABCDGE type electron transport complex subunit D [Clostridia bacterium]|nr:RnfABCDGE type electron transport complex subunit D [Clostridia bacterium]
MLFALIPALIMATYLYGVRALLLCLLSVFSAVVSELAGCKITKQIPRFSDFSSVYIGLLLALMLPASSPWWLPVIGSAFAVLIVKTPFGGADSAPFSCTAAAFAFLSICFSKETFAYPVVESSAATKIFGSVDFVEGTSVAGSLLNNRLHGVTAVELINAFIGTVPGPMGMTSAALLIGVLIYVLIRRPKNFVNAVSFVAVWLVFCVASVIYDKGLVLSESIFRMIFVRLFSGFALCIAAFLITEEPTSPKKISHRVLYGITAGVAYVILRRFSVFEDAGCFAVLAVNAMWPVASKYIFTEKKEKSESEVTTSEN